MAVTFGAVAEYFGTAAVADGAVAVGGEIAATEVGGAAAAGVAGGAAGGAAVGAGAGTMAAAAASDAGGGAAVGAAGAGAGTAAAAGGTLGGSLGTSLATAAGGQVVGSLLAPKAPKAPGVKNPLTMPDPQAQDAATRRSLVEQLARRGRASTILTDTGSGKLGG